MFTRVIVSVEPKDSLSAGRIAMWLGKRGIHTITFKGGMMHFEEEGPRAAALLTDLRYAFPKGYVQGWTEPKG